MVGAHHDRAYLVSAHNGSGETAPWPSSFQGWFTVAVFFVTAILSYTDRLIFSLLVDPVRSSLGISDFQVGLAQGTSFAIVYALAGLPAGRLADTGNRRNLLLIGTFVWSAGTVACGFATGMTSLIAARMLVAAGEALLAPTAISMISDLFPPERRGRPTAAFLSGMNVGSGLAIVIGGGVLTLAQGGAFDSLGARHFEPWRTTLVLIGLMGIPLLALLILLREPRRRIHHDQWKRPFAVVLKEILGARKRILPLFAGLAALTTVDFALISWVPTLLSRGFDIPTREISSGFGLIILVCGFFGTVVGGVAADKLFMKGGNALRLRCAALLLLMGGIVIVFLPIASPSVVLLLSGFWLFVSAVAAICGIATAQDIVPADAKGLCIALIAMGNISFGLGIGASLPGALTGGVFDGPSGLSWALAIVTVPMAMIGAYLFNVKTASHRSTNE